MAHRPGQVSCSRDSGLVIWVTRLPHTHTHTVPPLHRLTIIKAGFACCFSKIVGFATVVLFPHSLTHTFACAFATNIQHLRQACPPLHTHEPRPPAPPVALLHDAHGYEASLLDGQEVAVQQAAAEVDLAGQVTHAPHPLLGCHVQQPKLGEESNSGEEKPQGLGQGVCMCVGGHQAGRAGTGPEAG